jgi:hypothetical protein
MPQIPEQIRPYVAVVVKYHFWIIAALVPLLLIPLLGQGTAGMADLISGQRSQIESRLSAVKSVQSIGPHPNDAWSKAVEAHTGTIREETLSEWTRFWDDQAFLRVWSPKLGGDFADAVGKLKPGESLKRPFLLRYQNTVPDLVRELPARMGTDDLMVGADAAAAAGGGEFAPRGGEPAPRGGAGAGAPPAGSRSLVVWRAEDQKKVFDAFKWEKPPTTVQVLLAQEELWVYGLFCDTIKRANAEAAGAYNAPITAVDQLAVGYPAAEEAPGGQGGARIITAAPAAGTPAPMEGMPSPDGAAAAAAVRPAHPRFGGGSGGGPSPADPALGGMDGAPAAVSPDDPLREWIYVDFAGKPLSAAELAASPAAKMVHLMPFVLRVVMDQRKIDALLADFAAAKIPIDVRQVRINVGATPGAAGGQPQPGVAGPRAYDVIVEIRGTVGLAASPDQKVIGGGEAPPPGGDA